MTEEKKKSKSTYELCREYGIPLPASLWEKYGLAVPKHQKLKSGRIVKTAAEEKKQSLDDVMDEWAFSLGKKIITLF
ncbi:MAG: hypothetical protein ACNYWM_11790 [Methanosarcinales archaeon]